MTECMHHQVTIFLYPISSHHPIHSFNITEKTAPTAPCWTSQNWLNWPPVSHQSHIPSGAAWHTCYTWHRQQEGFKNFHVLWAQYSWYPRRWWRLLSGLFGCTSSSRCHWRICFCICFRKCIFYSWWLQFGRYLHDYLAIVVKWLSHLSATSHASTVLSILKLLRHS